MKAPTNWILSSMNAVVTSPLSEGVHNLRIVDAKFNEDENYYAVTLSSLDKENEQSTLRYYILKKDGNRNEPAIGTLNKLGFCIYGQDAGIPYPQDIINGVVKATVRYSEYEGKSYVAIYSFEPVNRQTLDMVVQAGFPVIDQYTVQ